MKSIIMRTARSRRCAARPKPKAWSENRRSSSISGFSPSGATAYSVNTLTMAIGFAFLYLELGMRFSSLIFKRMRASTAIADAWKP